MGRSHVGVDVECTARLQCIRYGNNVPTFRAGASAMDPMITVEHLVKRYRKSAVAAVDDISFAGASPSTAPPS
jgi:hypothetical protein